MSYSKDVELAKRVATEAHKGAVDKAGADYILHSERVASRLDSDELKVVGWLHDVVEDTVIMLSDIGRMFGNETAAAVEAITHRKGEAWSDYLIRVKANPVAKAVKVSDLLDNSNMTRLSKITPRDIRRTEKYLRALRFLLDLDGE